MAKKKFKKIDFTEEEINLMKERLMEESNSLMEKAERLIRCYNDIANKRDLDGGFQNIEIANVCLEGKHLDGEWDELEKEIFEKLVPEDARDKRWLLFDF